MEQFETESNKFACFLPLFITKIKNIVFERY